VTQELKAGRDLDALIAHEVFGAFGFENIDVVNGPTNELFAVLPGNRAVNLVPYFSTQIAAAWEVVEKLDNRNDVAKEMGIVVCTIYRYGNGYTVRFFNSGATAETAPLAICLAALASLRSTLIPEKAK
jgi:hypothetical protein